MKLQLKINMEERKINRRTCNICSVNCQDNIRHKLQYVQQILIQQRFLLGQKDAHNKH